MIEESEEFMEQIQNLEENVIRAHNKNKKNFIISNICIVIFGFFTCLSIYFIVIDFNREPFIPVVMVCLIFMVFSIHYAILFGRKYYYKQGDGENVRRDRPRVRIPLTPQDEVFVEESDSRSSPADLTNPAIDGPSNLPQTESSTLSDQTSNESDSTKGTFTTTAIIEYVTVVETSCDVPSVTEEKIVSKNENEDPKPSTSSQLDSADCLTTDDSEDETGKVRHRRPTPK